MALSILIVENNPEENFYCEVLGRYGINVVTSVTLDDASKELNNNVSLLIFEHDKKKRDGFSFLKEYRERVKNSLIVILAKNPDIQDAVAFMKEGAFDYLPKPLGKEKLDSFARFLIESHKKLGAKPKLYPVNKTDNREIIGNSAKISEIVALCRKVARGKSTILIQGESGTGKELVARLIHQESDRAKKVFCCC